MVDFNLVKSFDIDDGQLDGLSPQEIFVLGYELGTLDESLKTGKPLTTIVHGDNRERIEKSCQTAEREFTLNWMEGDQAETWMILKISAAKSKGDNNAHDG